MSLNWDLFFVDFWRSSSSRRVLRMMVVSVKEGFKIMMHFLLYIAIHLKTSLDKFLKGMAQIIT